jgi:ribonuclease R
MRALGNEYFHHDPDTQTLMGADSGRIISLGQRATVRLAEATPVTGGLLLELLELDDKKMPSGPGIGRNRSGRRKGAKYKTKADKTKRKVNRKRRG